jgi:hypothetical protein
MQCRSIRPEHLTLEEASVALSAMAAGRRSIPPVAELRAMVASRRPRLTPATEKLIAEIVRATQQVQSAPDPIARSVADLVATVVAFARQQIETQERP